jgi:hypothetical protein
MNLNQLGINLDAYSNAGENQAFAGEANTSAENLQDLSKALEAGSITGQSTLNSTTASGSPLKTESLDSTLKIVTFTESEITLWKRIPKSAAYNTVEEYNQQESYGEDRGGFYGEGMTAQNEDSTYVRRSQLVKFLGVKKSVSHVMTLVNTMIGSAIAQEAKAGTMWILRKLNRSLATGDSRVVPYEFNGVYAQIARPDGTNFQYGSEQAYLDSELVVDCRGSILKEEHMEDAQSGIIDNHGLGNEIFASPQVFTNFVKGFYGDKRFIAGSAAQSNGKSGQRITSHQTQYGEVEFTHDIFLNKKKHITANTAKSAPGAPTAPVADGTTPITAVTGVGSKWSAGEAGDYVYAVTGVNYLGESAPTVLSTTPTTIAAGGAPVLKFAKSTADEASKQATGFIVYRGEKGKSAADTKFFKVFELALADVTAGYGGATPLSVRDMNNYMPNTNQAFMLQNTADIWTFRQLCPLMKMDLAITGPMYEFLVLLYGTPIIFSHKKLVKFINIGTNP